MLIFELCLFFSGAYFFKLCLFLSGAVVLKLAPTCGVASALGFQAGGVGALVAPVCQWLSTC